MIKIESKTTNVKVKYQVNGAEILAALIANGSLPKDITVKSMYVAVPGGGDWSNTNLDIDNDYPLVIITEDSVSEPTVIT